VLFLLDFQPLSAKFLLNLKFVLSGIYLHIPFCKQACSYCDFYFSTNTKLQTEVIAAICKEITDRRNYLASKQIKSIYFGGGTPSILSQQEIQSILKTIEHCFSCQNEAEITLEANPDDIARVNLEFWLKSGINRLSIGLQGFNNAELKWMNRAHTAEESVSSVKSAQNAGFNNITIDLIYGSKFQTLKTWKETLLRAIDLDTQHISAYNLTIEDRTVLGSKNKKGVEPPVDDGLSKEQFLMMLEIFADVGFEQYEISNFAKKGFRAVHNSNYWLQQPYLGIGPSAHSFDGKSRQWNVRNNHQYVKKINEGTAYFEREELTLNNRYNEYILTRLRTVWGCNQNEMNNLFGKEYTEKFVDEARKMKSCIVENENIFTLTLEGKLRADGIASAFFIL